MSVLELLNEGTADMFNYVCQVAKVQNPPPSGDSACLHFISPPLLMETTTLALFINIKKRLQQLGLSAS